MKQRVKTFLAGSLLALAIFGVVGAGQLEDGEAAWKRKDYTAAMRLWRPLAEQGDPGAQTSIGGLYFYGEGVPQDYEVGLMWYRKAAERGYAYAQLQLGVLYANGHGVRQDYVLAYMWWSLAASLWKGDGNNMAADARDLLVLKMTPAQIAEAQRMAREWVSK
jgi:uncharacterized protein